ncbi:MAG: DMT family transporter [Vibrionaceae bacterium]
MPAATLGILLALTTAVFWGALPIVMQQLLSVMSPITIVWYRFATAFIGLGLWLAWRKKLPSARGLSWHNVAIFLVASLGLAGNFVLFNSALGFVAPPVVQVIIQLAPVVLLLASAWLFKEKLGAHQIVGVIALFLGLMLFFNDRLFELFTSMSDYSLGVLLTLAAALVWVVYGLAQKKLLSHFSSAQILLVLYGLSAIWVTPFAKLEQVTMISGAQFCMLLFCCVNTLVAYGAFAEAMVRWQAAPVSAIVTLAPLFTILFTDIASLIWPETISWVALNGLSYAGALVVVGGAICCAVGHKLLQRWGSR